MPVYAGIIFVIFAAVFLFCIFDDNFLITVGQMTPSSKEHYHGRVDRLINLIEILPVLAPFIIALVIIGFGIMRVRKSMLVKAVQNYNAETVSYKER